MNTLTYEKSVRQWDMLELSLSSTRSITSDSFVLNGTPSVVPPEILSEVTFSPVLAGLTGGNPFDVKISAVFRYKNRIIEAEGFYDGDGLYKIRFMPDTKGKWSFVTVCSHPEMDGLSGEFLCTGPEKNSHGPVRVHKTYHFTYEDGTPYIPFGTTCYVWNHQGDELEEETLATLKAAPYNKLRMCVFPKDYDYNHNEPVYHAFEGSPEAGWDFGRFNPEFFRHLEKRVGDLMRLGIEADLILFHPYDRWGYAAMDTETDERYIRYLVARLAAFRNVWWSLANEYDLMNAKTDTDWDRFFKLVQESDPYQHLRSIHNCRGFYDHGKPWVTHCSIQHSDLAKVTEWRQLYQKPVVVDECCYEGNISHRWGNISGREMVYRFWEGFARGGYVGHGETFVHPEDILWWAKGGKLYGESTARIAFLRRLIEDGPGGGMDTAALGRDTHALAGKDDEFIIAYYGITQPIYKDLSLPEGKNYQIDIIDTWDMTVTPLDGTFSGDIRIDMPGKQYIALRILKIQEAGRICRQPQGDAV